MATNKTLTQFKTALSGGGARPNLFEVGITLPGPAQAAVGSQIDAKFTLLCKAANLPASNIASIDVPFRGRTFKVAGDRTYDTWSITVINDTDFVIRTFMENWMQYIGQYKDASGVTSPNDYMASALVEQLTRTASTMTATSGDSISVAKSYKFEDIFPTNISAIDLSFDSSDAIEEFTVEFQVNYWYPTGTTGGKTNPT
jgi:hypothetical protein